MVGGWLAGLVCREMGGFGIAMQEPVHRLGACKGKWSGVWFPKKKVEWRLRRGLGPLGDAGRSSSRRGLDRRLAAGGKFATFLPRC